MTTDKVQALVESLRGTQYTLYTERTQAADLIEKLAALPDEFERGDDVPEEFCGVCGDLRFDELMTRISAIFTEVLDK